MLQLSLERFLHCITQIPIRKLGKYGIGGVKKRLGKLPLGQKWKDKPRRVESFLSSVLFGAFVNALNNRS